MEKQKRIKWFLAIISVVIIWSMSWSIYKVALNYTPPLLFGGMRSLLGGVILALVLLPQWRKIQWQKYWYVYVIVALFNTTIFIGVQSVGLQYLPSGLFSVIVYIQPVLVVLLARIWLRESISPLKAVGLIIGFLGVATVSIRGISGDISVTGILLALFSASGWAIGIVYTKKTSAYVHSLWLVALQFIIGGLFLISAGIMTESFSAIVWNPIYIASLFYGGIFGGVCATALYFKLMSSSEASKVGSFIFLVPLLAVVYGCLFLNEPVSISLFEGMALIILSIYLINKKVGYKPKTEMYP